MSTGNERAGFVYIVQSECIQVNDPAGELRCPVKIGSACDLYNRIGTLDSAVPIDFKIIMTAETSDYKKLEADVHDKLNQWRFPQGSKSTEFFTCSIKVAKDALREVGMRRKYKATFCTRFVQLGRSAQKMKRLKSDLESGKIEFTCKNTKLGYDATAKYENGEFVIQPGAKIRKDPVKSFLTRPPYKYHKRWKSLMASYETGLIKKPIKCSGPAEAASIVCASIRNGNDEWVAKDGQHTLGEYLCRETRRSMKDEGDE